MKAAVLVSFVAISTSANFAVAQNLFENPSFDNGTSFWTLSPQSTWSTTNHTDGDIKSGSVLVQEFITDPTEHGSVSQCVPVDAGASYLISAWVSYPPIVPRACQFPSWQFQVDWWSDNACGFNGDKLSSIESSDEPATRDWSLQSFGATAPAFARSALVSFLTSCSSFNGTSAFYFDDVSMGGDDIFIGDFENGVGI